jgi:hypothetical protein
VRDVLPRCGVADADIADIPSLADHAGVERRGLSRLSGQDQPGFS